MVQLLNGRSKTRAKRLAILRGAAEAFRDRGYAGAGMRDIARRLEMAPGNLYYYFRDKHDLLAFCQEEACGRLLAEAARARRTPGGPARQLRALIAAHLRCILDELPGAGAHLEVHALRPAPRRRILAQRDRYERVLRTLIARGVRSRAFAPCDPKLAALAILGAVNGTAQWYRPDGPFPPGRIAEEFADYLVRGLRRS
ncbi:MAG: TetR/AcrR family transcriptional regulator [Planctomycetes bacterium]|nr:TetR/AcrR family transcriptional regulator [Planctomycetota bacterium]